MHGFYLQCDLVCQYSLLAFILRAMPNPPGFLDGVSEDCIAVARHTLDLHQQCMMGLRESKNDPCTKTRYIN